MTANQIEFRFTSDPRVADQLEANLLSELRAKSEQGQNSQISLEARDENNTLVGGLVGSTSYGWLLIKVLWVAVEVRKQGYGRSLVERATEQARSIGCHSVWLDASDIDARQFYRSLGFEEFGVLGNGIGYHPDIHRRFFLKKHI